MKKLLVVLMFLLTETASAQPYVVFSGGNNEFGSLALGYQVSENAAVEASGFMLNGEDGAALSVVGSAPISPAWSLIAKFGVSYLNADPAPISRQWAISGGAGVQYNISKAGGVRVLVEHYAHIEKPVSVISLGLLVRF